MVRTMGFCHPVAFGASDGRLNGNKAYIHSESDRFRIDVARTGVGTPLNPIWRNPLRKSHFNAQYHQIPDHVTRNARLRFHIGQDIPVATIQGKSHSNLLAIVAWDYESVGAPLGVLLYGTAILPSCARSTRLLPLDRSNPFARMSL